VRRLVERRRQQHDDARVVPDEVLVERLHRDARALCFTRSGDYAPALRDRVDLAFIAGARAKWRAIVEVRAAVPFAIPR